MLDWGKKAQELSEAHHMKLFAMLEDWYEAIRIAAVGSCGAVDVALHYLVMRNAAEKTASPVYLQSGIIWNGVDESNDALQTLAEEAENQVVVFKRNTLDKGERHRLEHLAKTIAEQKEGDMKEFPKMLIFAEQRISTVVVKHFIETYPGFRGRDIRVINT